MVKKIAKVAIVGKAGSGKDTVYKILSKNRYNQVILTGQVEMKKIAFADSVKEIAMKMYPFLKRNILFGPSKLRSAIIPNSFKDGQPLTVRQLLIDIGTKLGRSYNENIWIENLILKVNKLNKFQTNKMIVVTDVRFRNEFDALKNNNFFMIKLNRDDHTLINDISETQQDEIKNYEFNFILNNNGTLKELEKEIVNKLIPAIWNSV